MYSWYMWRKKQKTFSLDCLQVCVLGVWENPSVIYETDNEEHAGRVSMKSSIREKNLFLLESFFRVCVILTTYWEFNWKMFKIYWLFRAIIFAELKSIKFANEPIEMAHYILLNSTNYHFWWRWRLVQRGLLIF